MAAKQEEEEHDWRVTTDATARATDTEAFLRELRIQRGQTAEASSGNDELSLVSAKNAIKIILLGDSAVGKTKLVERFLMDGYQPQQLSTFALTLFRYNFKHPVDGKEFAIDFWDTAGQERFENLHPSYFYRAHSAILGFDVTRKVTYKNLDKWYKELREYCPGIPCLVVANKIDLDYKVTQKSFAFPEKNGLPFFFVSAADGTNVVKAFTKAIEAGIEHKEKPPDDFFSEVLDLLNSD